MRVRWIAICLLLLQLWLELSTLPITTPTVDEPVHVVRGYAFVARGDDRLRLRGPVLPNALSGASLLLEPTLQLPPTDDPMWQDPDGIDLSRWFMWKNAVPSQLIIFLARLPIIFVSIVLSAFVFRWASLRTRAWPALGALLLCVFCPNLLAHARLATADLVTAATFFISAYAFDRALQTSRLSARAASGFTLGLALAAKFTSFVLPVAFLVQAGIYIWLRRGKRRAIRTAALTLFLTFVGSALTLWIVYGLKVAPLRPDGIVLPAPSYWAEWEALFKYLQGSVLQGYLLGQVSLQGWWYYYPVTFLVKTPLPVLIFAGASLGYALYRREWERTLALWLAPALFFGSLLLSPHDIGYRYLLPVLPFLFVASADVFVWAMRRRWARLAVGGMLAWQIWGIVSIYPYYLPFFNEIAGGPLHGRYILSDSNVDWGQDLIGLKQYVDQQHIEHLKLSYFGSAPPSAYGLRVEPLPLVQQNMMDQGPYWLHTYYPLDPEPGIYAISVFNLTLGHWFDINAYAFFRDRQPDTTIGYSIYVFTVPSRGTPIDLALSGLQVDQIDPETHARFGTNDVRARWFDASSSLISGSSGETWVALADAQSIAPEWTSLFEGIEPEIRARTVPDDQPYRLYHIDLGDRLLRAAQASNQTAAWSTELYPSVSNNPVTLPVKFGDTAELMGYDVKRSDRDLKLITYWRAGEHVVTPLQMFAHVLGPDGSIVAQQDRLDATAYGWRTGDMIAQVDQFTLPDVPGQYWLQVGLYNSDSNERVSVMIDGQPVDQRLLLQPVEVK